MTEIQKSINKNPSGKCDASLSCFTSKTADIGLGATLKAFYAKNYRGFFHERIASQIMANDSVLFFK